MRPVANKWPVSQGFGVVNPRYAIGFHTGDDFACPLGTPVRAPFRSTITRVATSSADYGLYIEMRGIGGKRSWLYAHLSRVTVKEGDTVKAGDIVAYSGNSGASTAPHLHAEERHAPFGYRDCQNPTAW